MRRPDLIKSHQKRLQNIKKKSFELSTLCGVDVCVISFSADGRKVDTWPENSNEVKAILNRYKKHQSEHQSKLNKCDIGASAQFQRNTFLSSTTDDILPLLNKLSSHSLKIFTEQIIDRIKRISKRIDLLKYQSLQPSLFFVNEMDCNINQSNPNIDFANARLDSQQLDELDELRPDFQQLYGSNELLSSNERFDSRQLPGVNEHLGSFGGPDSQQLYGSNELLSSNGRLDAQQLDELDELLSFFVGPDIQQLYASNELLSSNGRLDSQLT